MKAIASVLKSAFALSLVIGFSVFCRPACAEESLQIPKGFKIPVYFVTDRARKDKTFGAHRKYAIDCKHDPYYGLCYVCLPNLENKALTKEEENLGWTAYNGKIPPVYEKEIIAEASPLACKDNFFGRLKLQIEKASGKAFLYIHGSNNTFEWAAKNCAELSYRSQSPAILYSWPSVGKLLCYQIDEGNVEWTLDHFKSFLNDLIEYKVMPPSSLTVVAHSLGNRLIVWSGEELTKNPLLKQVVMISPDMDNETFKHYARRYQESKINGMLLLSFRDRALPISQMLHGGYYRMGESLDPFFSLVARPTDMLQSAVEVISDPLVRFFSAIPGAGGANVLHAEPIAEKDDDDASPFKIIDYTELDHGLIGHKIPWGLVANLCVGGKPAPGQSLVARTDINFNLLSRFMRWAFDMAPQTVSDKTAVLHVVTE